MIAGRSSGLKWFSIFLAVAAMCCLFYGFYFSRVVSNIGLFLAGVFSILHWKNTINVFKDNWYWTIFGIVIIVVLSDIWYEGLEFFTHRGVMKAALLVYPTFVFSVTSEYPKARQWIPVGIIITVLLSSIYSLSAYFSDFENFNVSYKSSGIIPVLSYGDHIRIGWLTVISIILAFQIWKSTHYTLGHIFLFSFVLFEVIFLHILGSKTGLITLYIALFILLLFHFPRRFKWVFPLIIIFVLSLPIVAYYYVPTFTERVNFMKYDYEFYSRGEYRLGLSDAVRFFSLKAGSDLIKDAPIVGHGFSNTLSVTREWYAQNKPSVPLTSQFIPSSQYILYWVGGGILGIVLLLWHVVLPFSKKRCRSNAYFLSFFTGAVISFLFETPLESQLPLFIYGFFLAWFWYSANDFDSV
ncbi:MAG: O-antigen ligase family protein [Saprospiraceae bacterium]